MVYGVLLPSCLVPWWHTPALQTTVTVAALWLGRDVFFTSMTLSPFVKKIAKVGNFLTKPLACIVLAMYVLCVCVCVCVSIAVVMIKSFGMHDWYKSKKLN